MSTFTAPDTITLEVTEADLHKAVEHLGRKIRTPGVKLCTHCTIAQAILRQIPRVWDVDVKLGTVYIEWHEIRGKYRGYYKVEPEQLPAMQTLTEPNAHEFRSAEGVSRMRAVLPLTLKFHREDSCSEA